MGMEYKLLHNADARFSREGRTEDRYVDGYRGDIDPLSTIDATLEAIWIKHNRDDRPDGKFRPSLSMGDAVLLGDEFGAYTVAMIGFEYLPEAPTTILPDYPDR